MQMIGLARLGRDAELRQTANGDSVTNLSLAFNYGRKGDDGKRPTQWVEGTLWGNRAEALCEYLVKGQAVCVTLDDVHTEEYEGRNGTGYKLVGTVSAVEFAGSPPEQQGSNQQQRGQGGSQQRGQGSSQQRGNGSNRSSSNGNRSSNQSRGGGLDQMDDDIPF